jgi:CRISPR-associated protein Cmr2
MTQYTAISFAPVQSFIEKSRKLRDLYGASGILSYLSCALINNAPTDCEVISPGMLDVQRGTPNRILVKGDYSRDDVTQALLDAWQKLMHHCRNWIETALNEQFPQAQYEWREQWDKWGRYHWEIFWGQGESIPQAMDDLEQRKLRRDWIGVNWTGESSSLSGTDAIAYPRLGAFNSHPGDRLPKAERDQLAAFYTALAAKLETSSESNLIGKFLVPNERLSIPELAKRLVTWPDLAKEIDIDGLDRSFTEIHRNTRDGPGQWTAWFMGDGDRMGDTLKQIAATPTGDEDLKTFSNALRRWGEGLMRDFPKELGRVVYAGGDDFLGVLYGQSPTTPISSQAVLRWLMGLNPQWQTLNQETEPVRQRAGLTPMTLSAGFVWVSPGVPQRDVLQHCREAEKRAKKLGRDRVTIRVVFESGQYVQWTCRWKDLKVLEHYRDRNDQGYSENPNWGHIFSDWAELKARHAIPIAADETDVDDAIALELFDIYFPGYKGFVA